MNIVENQPLNPPIHCDEPRSGELNLFKYLRERFNFKTIIDIGAQGDFEFCEIFNKSEIHLFEPNKYWFLNLLKSMPLIERNNIIFNNFGLGDIEDYFKYYYKGESVYNHDGIELTDRIFITTLKKYLDSRKVQKVDFLKIDIEGYEYEAISGAGDRLKDIDFIQFEYNDRWIIAKKTLKMMYDLFPDRYFYHIESDKLNLAPYYGEFYRYTDFLITKEKL